MEILSIKIGDKLFGIELKNIREIVESDSSTEVPLTPDYVEGVINLRGNPVPIIDLKKKIGIEGKAESRNVVLCNINNSTVGLRTDDVLTIHKFKGDEFKNVPESLEEEIETHYLKGIVEINQDKYLIIDVDELI